MRDWLEAESRVAQAFKYIDENIPNNQSKIIKAKKWSKNSQKVLEVLHST